MEIVTGSTGEVHVTPIDDAVRNASVGYLDRKIVFDVYDVFAATIVANREIHVSSGYGENQGRIFKIDDGDYDSVPIENGTQGAKRADLIVARYSMDVQTGFEDISLAVIKGELSSTSYIDPTYETGDINSAIISSTFHDDFPLYRVRLDGTQIVAVDRLFTPVPDGGRIGVLEAAFEAHKDRFDMTNYRTDLASESAVYPSRVDADGQGNINVRPGVEGVLPASHGGTGQSNLKSGAIGLIGALDTNGIAPTNNDYYIGTTPGTAGFQRKPLATLWEWISSKLSNLGYGDMLKSYFCDNPDSEAPSIKQSRGGTGSRDGSINGVKLGRNGSTMGYYDSNNNFKSFRQPTGNAQAAQVLSGYTFANASSDSLSGSMANRPAITQRTSLAFASPYFYARFPQGAYLTNASSGYPEVQLLGSDMGDASAAQVLSNKYFTSSAGLKVKGTMTDYSVTTPAIRPSGGTGSQTIDLSPGYYTKISVDRTSVYDYGHASGYATATNRSWSSGTLKAVALNSGECVVNYDMKNVSSVKISAMSLGVTYAFVSTPMTSAFSGTTITNNSVNVTPTARYLAVRSYGTIQVELTEKADILR